MSTDWAGTESDALGRWRRMNERQRGLGGVADDSGVGLRSLTTLMSKADDAEDRDLIVIATTSDVDSMDEVVVPEGIDTSYFMANKSVFVDHRYNVEHRVGTIRTLDPWPSRDDFRGYRARIHMVENNPVADDLLNSARKGHGPGASIGFETVEAGPPSSEEKAKYSNGGREPSWVIRKSRMVELSLTFFPCNVSCQGVPMGSDGKRRGGVQDLVRKGLVTERSARIMGWRPTPEPAQTRLIIIDP